MNENVIITTDDSDKSERKFCITFNVVQANSLDDAKAEVHEQGGPGLFDDEYGIRRFCPQIEIVRWKDVGLSYDVEWTEK
jgi:hypothetical protein